MNKLAYKLATGITTGAILVSAVAPAAFAATNVSVSGNGNKSINTASVTNKQKSKVQQTNTATVKNPTTIKNKTGNNKANNNTGDGAVTVGSGNASATVMNTVGVGGNLANVESCGCDLGDTDVIIEDNGNKSINTVSITNSSKSTVQQTNTTTVVNKTNVTQNTGHNTANGNTGGDVDVSSGDATADVTNDVATGSNQVNP